MKKAALAILLTVLTLLAGAALADSTCPVNPYRRDVMAFEQIAREIREEAARESSGLRTNETAKKGLLVTQHRGLSMNGTGEWSIALPSGKYVDDVETMRVYLGMWDWTDRDMHVHYIRRDKGKDDVVFIDHYTSPEILTSGKYQVYFHVVYTSGEKAYWYEEYTVSGTDALGNKIRSVAAGCKASTKWRTALNLHDWLTHNLYYDLNFEFYGADSILRGYGVCDSYSKIYCMLCEAAGIPVRRITNDNHAWNAIQLAGNWFLVDCTWDDPSGALTAVSGSERHTYFCLNEELMALDHPKDWEWNTGSPESCTELSANYCVHTGEWKNWGDYEYVWDDDGGHWVVHTLSELVEDAFAGGAVQYLFSWAERENEDGDIWLWEMDGADDISSVYITQREKELIAYALPGASFRLDDDSVRVKVSRNSQKIRISLAGWDIEETGALKLPKGLKSVPSNAFENAAATTLVIPDGCESIGAAAFRNSGIRTVTVPGSVTSIAEDAFDGCGRIIMITSGSAAKSYAKKHGMLVVAP